MKKILVIFLTFCFFVQPVLAVESLSTSSNKIKEQSQIKEEEQNQENFFNEGLNTQNQIRNRIQNTNQNLQQTRLEFQQKLQEIKDQQKQKIISNLDKSYAHINYRWTTHFKNVLERLRRILDKVKILIEKKDPNKLSEVNKIFQEIEETENLVETQSQKVYTIQITEVNKLGESAREVHSQLREDLENLRNRIKKIRDSIHKLIIYLKPTQVTIQPTPKE